MVKKGGTKTGNLYLFTLSSHNQTCHAVWNTGARCQEGDAHDVVGDVQRVTDDGDLRHGGDIVSSSAATQTSRVIFKRCVLLKTFRGELFLFLSLLTIHTMR